ncbi:MAG: zinc-dependent metalloprotease [Gemmatimonadota bacterium]
MRILTALVLASTALTAWASPARSVPLSSVSIVSAPLQERDSADAQAAPDSANGDPTIEERTEGMEKLDGFIPVYWDGEEGKLWLEIARWDQDILHYTSLPAGFGQNDLGLNRGDLGGSRVVRFERAGPKVFMHEPNTRYRAITKDDMERRSVEDGFPSAIHWGFEVEAQTDDRVLVDATDFFLRDWHGVIGALRRSNQGTYRLEQSRSAPYRPRTRVFPENTEVEVTLTFASDDGGGLVGSVAADAGAVTVRQHHSFVQLPELGSYTPRAFDPRAGYGAVSWYDFATPIGTPLVKRYIRRHRLEKRDPSAEVSEAVEPIVYYLDPGTPEPVRTALLEGGRWWEQAFEAAGFRNAFRMEMLPDTADPMDARYNVVQWVHRSTRGWSYGASIADPRTGEILKGHVTLGSLRVRQDFLIGNALTAPFVSGDEMPEDVLEMSLLRIRQLSAHEIGHTIGLSHNYIASAQRAAGSMSVMDYPHPHVALAADGSVDVTEAYDTEIGEWDEVAIRYGYSDFPEGTDEAAELDRILSQATERGVTFITDQDARPAGGAHPRAHLWDNGADAASELTRVMDVRRAALDRFGERVVQSGMPLATMEEALVPLYLFHRYQAEAAAKVVGGLYYTYALRGDGQEPLHRVPAAEQRAALDALLRTLQPAELALPRHVLATLPPRPPGYGGAELGGGAELFRRWTGLVFDAVAPAAAAADLTLGMLLHQERAARLVEQHALDPAQPGLLDVFEALREAVLDAPVSDGYQREVSRAVQRVYVDRLMGLASSADMPQVRALATYELRRIGERFDQPDAADPASAAHGFLVANDIERYLSRPMDAPSAPGVPGTPPGSPIGSAGPYWLAPVNGVWMASEADPLWCEWR